ncbi:MAG: hypothetical protein EA402_04925 [Planctomycetota bacterium]|nr:MAG: hypothetical protein EA402_04925 [Planctomycetota bacterium]
MRNGRSLLGACCPLILLAALAAAGPRVYGSDREPPTGLSTASGEQGALQALWRDLQRGLASDLATVDSRLFIYPLGMDSGREGMVVRWTARLPRAILALPDAPRQQAINTLEQRLQRELTQLPAAAHGATAIHFLPAPSAVAILRRDANRAFDLGDFSTFLALHRLLAVLKPHPLEASPDKARRLQIAQSALAGDPQSPWTVPLPAPGPLVPIDPKGLEGVSDETGLWHWDTDRLMALDPYRQVRWQRPLPRRAQVWAAGSYALVWSPLSTLLIDTEGDERSLSLPPAIRPLGMHGDAAWFYQGRQVYRYRLREQDHSRLSLPAVPLLPPLVNGDTSLWLSEYEVVLVEGAEVRHRYVHGLRLSGQLRWLSPPGQQQPILRMRDGEDRQYWRLSPYPEAADRVTAMHHANRALRHREALELWRTIPEENRHRAGSELAIALLAILGDQNAEPAPLELTEALNVVEDDHWRLRLLAEIHRRQGLDASLLTIATSLAAAHPHLAISREPVVRPVHPSEDWRYLISAETWKTLVSDEQNHAAAQERRIHAFVADDDHAKPPEPLRLKRHRQPGADTRLLIGDDEVTLVFGPDHTQLSRFAGPASDGRLRWRQRWAAPDYLPGRSVDATGDMLMVAEGQSRLHAIDPHSGQRLAALRVPNGLAMVSQARLLTAGRIAILHPISVNRQVTLVDASNTETIGLEYPARWWFNLGGELFIYDGQDSLLALPSKRRLAMPKPAFATAPWTGNGIISDGELHWRAIWQAAED